MINKKIFASITILLALTACSNNKSSSIEEEMVHVSIYKDNYINLLGEENINKLSELGLDFENGEITMFGSSLSSYTFTDYDGNTVNLNEGPYVLEVLSPDCKYCQKQTRETLQTLLDNGIKVYQYFISSENEDIDNFYNEAGMLKPDNVIILRNCSSFEGLIRKRNITSIPLTIIVNDEGKVSITHIGAMDIDTLISLYDYGLNNKLYEIEIDGLDLYSYLKRQTKIKDYIDNLEEIDMPKSILDD